MRNDKQIRIRGYHARRQARMLVALNFIVWAFVLYTIALFF